MGGEWVFDAGSRLDSIALFQDGPTVDVNVEKVQLLVTVGDVPVLVDPQKRILDLVAGGGGLVNAKVDGDAVFPRVGADLLKEMGVFGGFDEGKGLLGIGSYVVGGFGQEQCLSADRGGFLDDCMGHEMIGWGRMEKGGIQTDAGHTAGDCGLWMQWSRFGRWPGWHVRADDGVGRGQW